MAAQKTFRMLNAIIDNGGDLLEEGKPNPAERSWLRLAAGCAMLKICEQKGVGDQFTTEQYYTLSRLVTDPVIQVREHFLSKLHKGLSRGLPNKCLPLDFMGLFALAGLEADKRLRGLAKNFMVNNINKRREYMKSVMQGGGEKASAQLPHIMPDYMLVFAVPVLTHDLNFTSHTDVEYLKRIRLALWFVLEPLMTKNENYSFGFYQELIQKMKNHKDAFKGDDEAVNQKLWAVCDLAMGIITTRTTNFERKEFLSDVRWPLLDCLHAHPLSLLLSGSLLCISKPEMTPTSRTSNRTCQQNYSTPPPRRQPPPQREPRWARPCTQCQASWRAGAGWTCLQMLERAAVAAA